MIDLNVCRAVLLTLLLKHVVLFHTLNHKCIALDSNTIQYQLVSLQGELVTQTLLKISEVAEKISADCSESESGPI